MLRERLFILKNNLGSISLKEFLIRFLLVFIGSNLLSIITKYLIVQILGYEHWIEQIIYYSFYIFYLIWGVNWILDKSQKTVLSSPTTVFSTVSGFLFSSKSNEEIFLPIISDWQEEYYEALIKKEIWKARWINLRYTYAFLTAIYMKSPIGDLIEFIRNFAK